MLCKNHYMFAFCIFKFKFVFRMKNVAFTVIPSGRKPGTKPCCVEGLNLTT